MPKPSIPTRDPGDYRYTPAVMRADLADRLDLAAKAGRRYRRLRDRPDAAYVAPVLPEKISEQVGWEIGGQGQEWQRLCREAFVAGFEADNG